MLKQQRPSLIDERSLFISFVVPVYNEEANISEFIQCLKAKAASLTQNYEIILIDDGSQDQTVTIIEKQFLAEPAVKLLALSRNFGKEVALTAGLHHCEGDVAILIDADFQHPLDAIDEFLAQWSKGYDMIYGVRSTRANESLLKRSFTRVFYKLLRFLSNTNIPPNAGDFRLLDRQVIESVNSCDEYDRFMKGLYAWVGFSSTGIVYNVQERQGGKTSFSFFKLTELALTGIISFSDVPLRVWSLIGIAISGISLIYACIIVIDTLCFGVDVPGFATLAVAIMFFGGVQLISIGILGEYLARVFREVKRRPKYILARKEGFEEESR